MTRILFSTIRLFVLISMLFALCSTVAPVQADSTFYVNSNSDTPDVNVGDGFCKDQYKLCSLRAAIQESNSDTDTDTIIIQDLAVDNFLIDSALQILNPVAIEGQGMDVTSIYHNGVPTVTNVGFEVRATLTLNKLEIRYFSTAVQIKTSGLTVNINDSRLADSMIGLEFQQASTANIDRSTISNNDQGLLISNGAVNLDTSTVIGNDGASCSGSMITTGGSLFAVDSNFYDNNSSGNGGAICNKGGELELWHSTVSGNVSTSNGGGIYQDTGRTTIKGDSRIIDNYADYGGGIYIGSGLFFTENLNENWPEITGNEAAVSGGGISILGGVSTLVETLIDGNTAQQSAGILLAGTSSLTIRDSAVVRNIATHGDAGGLSMYEATSTLKATNTTFSGNQATGNGGGLYLYQGTVYLSNTTISDNTANSDTSDGGQGGGIWRFSALVHMQNSIVADNHNFTELFNPYAPNISGAVGSSGYNLIGYCNLLCTITDNLTGTFVGVTTPGLDPLTTNKFAPRPYSPHHPLQATSLAVNGGNPTGCKDSQSNPLTLDQIGYQRTYAGRCDMGAVESPFVPVDAITSLVVNPDTVIGGNEVTVTGTVTVDRTAPSGGTIVTLFSDSLYAVAPATVTIPQDSTSQTFTIITGSVNNDLMVTITAELNTSSQTATLTLRPVNAVPAIVSISLDPESIIGGNNVTATLTLDRVAPSGGTVVSLLSNNSTAIVPATVTIPEGATSQTFSVQTDVVSTETTTIISATLDSVTKTAVLTIQPISVIPLDFHVYLPMVVR